MISDGANSQGAWTRRIGHHYEGAFARAFASAPTETRVAERSTCGPIKPNPRWAPVCPILPETSDANMVSNKRKPWSEEDDRRLLELRAAGRSPISIGVQAIDCGTRWAPRDPAGPRENQYGGGPGRVAKQRIGTLSVPTLLPLALLLSSARKRPQRSEPLRPSAHRGREFRFQNSGRNVKRSFRLALHQEPRR
jgi:hypothetical protein